MPARSTRSAERSEACCGNCSIGRASPARPGRLRAKRGRISSSTKSRPASSTGSFFRVRSSSEFEWKECLRLVAAIEPFPRFLVASGSLPDGVPDDFYAQVARIAKQRGARLVLDTSGPALAAATAEGVDLIKPNLREMRELSGSEPSDAYEWEAAAKALVATGKVAIVALTMGHLGAALVTRNEVLRAPPIPITPRSAVGAGDSFLAALIWRLAAGASRADAFRLAVAAGAAALVHPGTELCRLEDVERLADQVTIENGVIAGAVAIACYTPFSSNALKSARARCASRLAVSEASPRPK